MAKKRGHNPDGQTSLITFRVAPDLLRLLRLYAEEMKLKTSSGRPMALSGVAREVMRDELEKWEKKQK